MKYATLAAIGIALCCPLSAQERVLTIDIHDYRPLAKALVMLQTATGVPINFEEPPYEHEDDLERSGKILAPRKAHLRSELRLAEEAATPDLASAKRNVEMLLKDATRCSIPGQYAVHEDGGFLTVVPIAIRGKGGTDAAATPISSSMIRITDRQAIVGTMLQEAVQAVSAFSGKKVACCLDIPSNFFIDQEVQLPDPPPQTFGGLVTAIVNTYRTGSNPRPKMYWQLLFDPGMQTYYLNIHFLKVEQPKASGHTVSIPAPEPKDGSHPFFNKQPIR